MTRSSAPCSTANVADLTPTPTLTRRGWTLSVLAWFLLCLVQAPPLTVADTKHDLVADPWGFLHQALSPWTDIFPLGQLQNQAYGYLFPHGLFFALLSPLPDWLTQRLWWTLLLTLAFAGTVKLLEATGTGSRTSRLIAAVLYALSPRILTTLGAISSEAWPVALVPWILLPLVRILATDAPPPRRVATAALSSTVAVLCLGAVNAVATAAAVLPALVWWLVAGVGRSGQRRTAWRFMAWWAPAMVLACFWWIGPLLILGRYSPPFTDYIESAGITTHWFSLGEILRGTTSWTPFLSDERQAGAALVSEPVFVAGTLIVALLGLLGLLRLRDSHRTAWLMMLATGLLIFGLAGPFSPVAEDVRSFLDGAGAPLRNLHKFDALVRLPLIVGVAHLLSRVRVPIQRAQWAHPERHRPVVVVLTVGLLLGVVTAPAWSGRLVPVDGYRSVPTYWSEAAAWLNNPENGASASRTMILPRAASARQNWGNTRDEPAQALLDVPWVVRDAVPLVPPEAIRGLDGVQREFDTGTASPTLAAALTQQGVGFLLVRSDLTSAADTPGARLVLRTLRTSPGFTEEASFGDGDIHIFRVGEDAATTAPRTIHVDDLDVVAGGAEVLPRLAAADGAARDRILVGDAAAAGLTGDLAGTPVTVTDTPALREHSFGTVTSPDSAIRAPSDPWRGMNPVRDYPSVGTLTEVRESGGHILASSAADDPTSLDGADTLSSVSAAVDDDPTTAWYPASGSPVNQSLTVSLDEPVQQLRLTAQAQGTSLRLQVTTSREGQTVASTTMQVSVGRETTVSLPPGSADQVELRITGAWGRAGLSEFSLTAPDGTDVTPRRDIVVPPLTDGSSPGRWVLGQEIAEGTMRRTVTVPDGGTEVTVTSADCGVDVLIDGVAVPCGATLALAGGDHEVRSTARWVELRTPASESSTGGSGDRIVVTPTAVNSGRQARLDVDGQSVDLEPVTVNGWQQGWLVPASWSAVASLTDEDLAAAVTVDFPATTTYRAWLAAGLAAALVLLGAWLFLLLSSRGGYQRDRERAPRPTGAVGTATAALAGAAVAWILAGIPGILVAAVTVGALQIPHRWIRGTWIVLVSGGLATVLFTRGPWGAGGLSNSYAGDSLTAQLLLVVCLSAVVAAPRADRAFHQRDTARRAGSSTSE